MSEVKLWDQALEGADYEAISKFAVEVPKVLADVSIGEDDKVVRHTGLILTKEQIISIKKYVALGLSFPDTLKGITDFLRYGPGEDGGPGLTAQDFLSTFTLIATHAKAWSPLRQRIMLTSVDLKSFGAKMQIWGRAMQRIYDGDDAAQLIKSNNVKTPEELNNLEFNWPGVFPGIELAPDTVPQLNDYLIDILKRIREYQGRTNAIKENLDTFASDLETKVVPAIKLRLALIGNNKYTGEIAALDKKITERALEIDELNAQYKALVQKSISSVGSFNIVGLGLAIYFGVEAENVRARRKRVNAEQDADIHSLSSKEMTLAALKRVEHDLQNAKIVAIDAEVATNNLRFVWNSIDRYITDSEQSMASIHDALKLYKFMSTFEEVVESWAQLAAVADQLIDVFDQADKEYKADSGVTPKVRFTGFSSRNAPIEPQVLSGTRQQMRKERATVDALYITLQFLPGVHDRFGRLVDNVFESTKTLLDAASDSHHQLTRTGKALGRLKKDLERETAGDADKELISEMTRDAHEELSGVYASVAKSARAIENHYANLSSKFDRQQTMSVMSALTEEVAAVDTAREQLEATSEQVRAELQVVTDAISAIEKTGLDDAAKQVNLTIDKVKALGVAPPQVAVVMLAIDQLQKSIADIAEGISFTIMVAESRKLREKLNDLLARIAAQNADVAVANKKIEFIQAIYRLDDQNTRHVTELNKVVMAYTGFLSSATLESDDVISRIEKFDEVVPAFLKLISPLAFPDS